MDKFLLDQRRRAEDILLGSLGFAEGASILSLEKCGKRYKGTGTWDEGGTFVFESDDDLDQLQDWAIEIFLAAGDNS